MNFIFVHLLDENMYINIGANSGSGKLWTNNTATSGKLINPLNTELNPICQ